SPAAEDLIRQCLIEVTGPALDRALFSAAPASDERPAGLLFGIAPTPAPAGDIIDALVALASAVAPVAGNDQLAIVAAPTQAVAINLRPPRAGVLQPNASPRPSRPAASPDARTLLRFLSRGWDWPCASERLPSTAGKSNSVAENNKTPLPAT